MEIKKEPKYITLKQFKEMLMFKIELEVIGIIILMFASSFIPYFGVTISFIILILVFLRIREIRKEKKKDE